MSFLVPYVFEQSNYNPRRKMANYILVSVFPQKGHEPSESKQPLWV